MRNTFFAVAVMLVTFSLSSHAAKGTRMHGGLGFLFTDANSFNNVGRFAYGNGTGVEVAYGHQTGSTVQHGLTTSAVMGSGSFGFGAAVSRSSTNLSNPDLSTDSAVVGMGVAIKDIVNFGVKYARVIDSGAQNNGTVSASLALIPKGRGFAAGLNYSSTLGGSSLTQTAQFAIGYQFSPMFTWELLASSSDFSNLANANPGTYFHFENNQLYFGAGYSYVRSNSVHEASARLGFLLSRADISVSASQTTASGAQPNYGATMRLVF